MIITRPKYFAQIAIASFTTVAACTPASQSVLRARAESSRSSGLRVMPNVWMDSVSRFPADDRYNPGQIIPQVESELAVDPNDPNNVIASAVYFGGVLHGPPSAANIRSTGGRTLATRDGGRTWKAVAEPQWGDYNLRVAYSKRYGDAYRLGGPGGASLAANREFYGIDVQRSDDKGETWISQNTRRRAVDGFRTDDTDQGNMVVDNGPESPYYGRIYLAPHHFRFWYNDARGAAEGWRVSEQSFTSAGTVFTSGFDVLPDGTVVLPFRKYQKNSEGVNELHVYVVTSKDGGKTFTTPRHVVQLDIIRFSYPKEAGRVFYAGVGTDSQAWLVADPSTGRFYCAYAKTVQEQRRIFLIYSADQGSTWSAPVAVSPGDPGNQFQLRSAVNHRGEIGVSWLDTRHNSGDTGFDEYFAFSSDAGRTFREVRVSSESSTPKWDFNQHQIPGEKWIVPGYDARRHLTGGDYIGLRADSNGDFVMTWPDSRKRDLPQMYFSKVIVSR